MRVSAVVRMRIVACRDDRLRDSKVGDDRRAAGDEDVVRLDVAVHDAVLVRVGERLGDVAENADRRANRQRSRLKHLAQRRALDEGHGIVGKAVRLARREHGDDVRMLEPRGELDLALESRDGEPAASSGGSTLTTTLRPSARLLGDEDARHAAAAELTLDGVGGAEAGLELIASETASRGIDSRGVTSLSRRARTPLAGSHPSLPPGDSRIHAPHLF